MLKYLIKHGTTRLLRNYYMKDTAKNTPTIIIVQLNNNKVI